MQPATCQGKAVLEPVYYQLAGNLYGRRKKETSGEYIFSTAASWVVVYTAMLITYTLTYLYA
jgi:hypothetical protein